jgi:hypothetical protein
VIILEIAPVRLGQFSLKMYNRYTGIGDVNGNALINNVYPSTLSRLTIVDKALELTTQATKKPD